MVNKKDIFKLLQLKNKIELIGSNSANLKYDTDFDLQEKIKVKTIEQYNEVSAKIKRIFEVVGHNPNMFITDMKAGSFNTYPIRWTYDDVMKGFQQIDTKTIMLIDALQDLHSTVKIDLIVKMDNEYKEFSCNYYFTANKKNKSDICTSLLLNIKQLYHEKEYMKMLKRLMSYRKINKLNVDNFIDFFNSHAGLLYQIVHKLQVILDILDFENDFTSIKQAVNEIYQLVPNEYKVYTKVVTEKNINKVLEKLIHMLNVDINKLVVEFVNK